jgi:hypothetical protein
MADEWKQAVMIFVVFVAGGVVGYMATQAQANQMAKEQCGLCQQNLGIMVENFNLVSQKCELMKTYVDVSVFPPLNMNQTVRAYAP